MEDWTSERTGGQQFSTDVSRISPSLPGISAADSFAVLWFAGPPALLLPLHQPPPQLQSYLVLLRLLTLHLLQLASTSSHARTSSSKLQALPLLLDTASYAGAAKEEYAHRWVDELRYQVLRADGMSLLGRGLSNIVRFRSTPKLRRSWKLY